MKTLDQFVLEIKTEIDNFAAEYRAKAEKECDYYPIEFPDENEGLWIEFFIGYLNGGGL